jgi:hypothetical protein
MKVDMDVDVDSDWDSDPDPESCGGIEYDVESGTATFGVGAGHRGAP